MEGSQWRMSPGSAQQYSGCSSETQNHGQLQYLHRIHGTIGIFSNYTWKKNHKNPSTRILLLSHVTSPRSVGPLAGCLATGFEVQKFRSEKAQKEAEVGKVRGSSMFLRVENWKTPGVPKNLTSESFRMIYLLEGEGFTNSWGWCWKGF